MHKLLIVYTISVIVLVMYCRSREDTVRRIVSDLTGDSGNELSEELVKGQPLVLDNSYHSDEDATNWESWQPDPIDADPSKYPDCFET